MDNVTDIQLAQLVKVNSTDVLGRLMQIRAIASKSGNRSGCADIAAVCETAINSLPKNWLAILSTSLVLAPHVVFKMASTLRSEEPPSVFLTVELFPPNAVEVIIFGNHKERLIAWHSDWVRSHAELIWSFSLPVFALITHVALHERCAIEEQSEDRVVFVCRGTNTQGWAKVTIDLSVAEKDAAFMEEAMQRLETNTYGDNDGG